MWKLPITPRLIAISISILFLLGIFLYIGLQIKQFQSPPNIKISSPESEIEVNNENILIEGKTEKNTSVYIQKQTVYINN